MKILHTSDWHLGANIEGQSRFDEQMETLNEIAKIADEQNVDIILIAGDVFINPNMPSHADHMFEKALIKLCNNGNRAVVAVSGNNDVPERFVACRELALTQNCFLFNNLDTNFDESLYPLNKNIKLTNYGKGFIELTKNNESCVIAFMPYPAFFGNEKSKSNSEEFEQKIERLLNLASLGFKDDSFNITLAHLFVPSVDKPNDAYIEVLPSVFPQKSNYVALGHVHNLIAVDEEKNIYYSGATINLHFEDKVVKNYVIVLETESNVLKNKQFIKLKSPKTILKINANNYLDAVEKLKKTNADYVRLVLKELEPNEFKKLKDEFSCLINISLLPQKIKKPNKNLSRDISSQKVFEEFFKHEYNKEPSEKLINCFNKLIKGDK